MLGARKSNSITVIVFVVHIIFCSHFKPTITATSFYTILIWGFPWLTPALYEEQGNIYFVRRNCTFQNCLVTSSHSYLDDVSKFDVIIYNNMVLWAFQRPESRSATQRYVFFSDEPSVVYPVSSSYNGFFDITWTYKLNSDATFKYIVVRDNEGKVIAPKRDVQWIERFEMKPTSVHVIQKLRTKRTAAAWFVTHCDTVGKREVFVKSLITELHEYDLKIDVFGPCGYGNLSCTQYNEECHALIELDYYFYLAFENSICEDYVTEKVLTALKHYTVPVVYGGADYSRFLPDGSYLDARYLGPKRLAYIMNKSIRNKKKYYDFFRWHNYYSFHAPNETAETDEICAFCALLNNKTFSREISVYEDITGFWNPKPRELHPDPWPDSNIA